MKNRSYVLVFWSANWLYVYIWSHSISRICCETVMDFYERNKIKIKIKTFVYWPVNFCTEITKKKEVSMSINHYIYRVWGITLNWLQVNQLFLAQVREEPSIQYVDPAMIGVLVVMAVMFIVICIVLRLFSKWVWPKDNIR